MNGYSFNSALKSMLYRIISRERVLRHWRNTKLQDKIIVLMYHDISEDEDKIEAWTVVRKSHFVRQMEYLSSHFDVVPLEEAIAQMGHPEGDQKPKVVITFDDGYAGYKEILLSVMKSMDIPVTLFLSTQSIQDQTLYWYDRVISALQGDEAIHLNLNPLSLGSYRFNQCRGAENWREIERLLRDLKILNPKIKENAVEYILKNLNGSQKRDSHRITPLSMEALRELAECPLITIGAHSHGHNILTHLTKEDVRKDVETSKLLLEKWIDRPVRYFSYPNGSYDDHVVHALKETGFECSVTTVARPWGKGDSFFAIPRIGIGRYDSFDLFKIKVSAGGLAKSVF